MTLKEIQAIAGTIMELAVISRRGGRELGID